MGGSQFDFLQTKAVIPQSAVAIAALLPVYLAEDDVNEERPLSVDLGTSLDAYVEDSMGTSNTAVVKTGFCFQSIKLFNSLLKLKLVRKMCYKNS